MATEAKTKAKEAKETKEAKTGMKPKTKAFIANVVVGFICAAGGFFIAKKYA